MRIICIMLIPSSSEASLFGALNKLPPSKLGVWSAPGAKNSFVFVFEIIRRSHVFEIFELIRRCIELIRRETELIQRESELIPRSQLVKNTSMSNQLGHETLHTMPGSYQCQPCQDMVVSAMNFQANYSKN